MLLAITPDPYFVLRNRPDLVLREYVPDSLPVAHDTYWHYLSKTDYIVIGKPNLLELPWRSLWRQTVCSRHRGDSGRWLLRAHL